MGHLPRRDLLTAYNRIKRDAAGRTCSVLILVSPTVDALCALKILTELLKCDFVPFKVVPVAGYDDIIKANDNFIQGRDEIRSVVMIDCGGTTELLELVSLSPEMIIYVLDSHRPYSLRNIFDNTQLVVLDDGFIEDNLTNLEDAYEGLKIDELGDAASSHSDSADEEGPHSSEDEENAADTENLPIRTRDEKIERRRRRQLFLQRYREYYGGGSFYGTSVARMAFDISDELGRHCNDYLWCSILGVTSQHVMELSTKAVYDADIAHLRERCLLLNRDSIGTTDDFANRDGRIRYEPEFRFMLTRHWTLFNSMLHSRYMATRLGVWREKGRRMLETFIVKMGIPLAQCKLDYSSMEMELKESLPMRISKHAAEFGIDDVSIPSFVRDFGFVMRLSACDAVYALMALIEAPYSAIEYCNLNGDGPVEDSSPIWIKNFYYALDALDYHHIEKLRRGIELAMKQQQIILHEASTILSHRLLRYGRRFRYVVLRHSSDLAWLSNHPLSLTKLTLFLSDATRTSKRSQTPLLLAAYQALTDTFLVVVWTSGSRGGGDGGGGEEYGRNRFGYAFRQAAEMVRARVKHDGFESALIEIRAGDLKGFLQTLQTIPL